MALHSKGDGYVVRGRDKLIKAEKVSGLNFSANIYEELNVIQLLAK